ncbi:MAG: hypothetical protein ACRDTC_26085 [Pseudonocardiaceae bacterium]
MNLSEVPDDVYEALAGAAEANRQSLNAFVVDRLFEAARVVTLGEYLSSDEPPRGTGVTLDAAVAAIREVREAS